MPNHYLNQCWNIVNSNLRNKRPWTLERNLYIFIHENAFESFVCEMAAIFFRLQCVKRHLRCVTSWIIFFFVNDDSIYTCDRWNVHWKQHLFSLSIYKPMLANCELQASRKPGRQFVETQIFTWEVTGYLRRLLLKLINLNPAWISNYISYKVWDEITYPFKISTVQQHLNSTHLLIISYPVHCLTLWFLIEWSSQLSFNS